MTLPRTIAVLLLAIPAYAGHPCLPCHEKQVAGYQRTGMANSLFRPLKQPSGSFTHALSGTTFAIESRNGAMRQKLERNGFAGEFPVDYVIGSGNHAFGYLVQVGDYLFQSPVSFYSRKKIWDVAPGYERDQNPDFTRPVTIECLLCHSGQPRAVEGSLNRYEQPPFGAESISCDRCHGPVATHLKHPAAQNIVNPAKLPPRARDSVCEQCHLGGEARIPNPGKRIADFQPGQDLEEILSVYVYQSPAGSGIKVVSHAEQLALSKCAQQSSGKLWCGTCHDPHDKPVDAAASYRAKCLGCHGESLVKTHPAPSEDCAGCHMQRQPARDGGHTAFTDHRISRKPSPAAPQLLQNQRRLVAWHEPSSAVSKRNLGLANITVGEREESAFHMDAGFRLLSDVYDSFQKDPAVLTALGLVILRKGRPLEAAQLYETALALQPAYAPYHINVATAWNEAGNTAKAIAHLNQAIEMDPSLEKAYRKLGDIYLRQNQRDKLRETLQRYLKFMPNNVSVQQALDEQ